MPEEENEDNHDSLHHRMPLEERLQLIGNGIIPRQAYQSISIEDLVIFVSEPDPNQFPASLEQLKKFLPIE